MSGECGSSEGERRGGGRQRGDALALRCSAMTAATRADARALLGAFLADDAHYRASAEVYGDGGAAALDRALDLFLAHPETGFVWLAQIEDDGALHTVGACVVCRAISTSRGAVVAKLDDVTIDAGWRGCGVGQRMLSALMAHLREHGIARIDSGCHRDNVGAWRFYERLGFRPLDEERIAVLL
jgi:ribosomal protein S18 acetylase RimI-like enzyme